MGGERRPLNCPRGPGERPPPTPGERDRAPSSTSPPSAQRLGPFSLSLSLSPSPCLLLSVPVSPRLPPSLRVSLSPASPRPSLSPSRSVSLRLPVSTSLPAALASPCSLLFLPSLSLSISLQPSYSHPCLSPLPPLRPSPLLLLASVSPSFCVLPPASPPPVPLSVSRPPGSPRANPTPAFDGGRQAVRGGFCSIKLFCPHSLAPLGSSFLSSPLRLRSRQVRPGSSLPEPERQTETGAGVGGAPERVKQRPEWGLRTAGGGRAAGPGDAEGRAPESGGRRDRQRLRASPRHSSSPRPPCRPPLPSPGRARPRTKRPCPRFQLGAGSWRVGWAPGAGQPPGGLASASTLRLPPTSSSF
ncbi:uncharacterized protein LOC112645102 [Canis lupus dingo]|uniref:uncharacterized protein LOC112645102 n=1 Tax=Canis lupus dingo TaxID=286419 RepID=UPI0020C42DD2|nr:uncharacterized protein LOC112645102 [Canis lupus dingo]